MAKVDVFLSGAEDYVSITALWLRNLTVVACVAACMNARGSNAAGCVVADRPRAKRSPNSLTIPIAASMSTRCQGMRIVRCLTTALRVQTGRFTKRGFAAHLYRRGVREEMGNDVVHYEG